MRRVRVTGRFYVFLLMLGVGLFFISRELFQFGVAEAIITKGSTNYAMTVNAVIVRDETVASYEGNGKLVYIAQEGAAVNVGDSIAEVYSAGFAVEAFEDLEKIRKNIRIYHQTVLDNIIDTELERLEANVQLQALELKRMVQSKSTGDITNVEKLLEQAMDERQAYLNANRKDDQKLNVYYEQEKTKTNAITSWKSERKAEKAGIVSFYLDGYESALTTDRISEYTFTDVQNVLNNRPLASQAKTTRLKQNIFKVVTDNKWYVLLMSNDTSWNPVSGQDFQMQMQGVNGFAFTGKVVAMQKSGDSVLAQIEVNSALGPMLTRRSGKMDIGVNLTGFYVPAKAIAYQNGQSGVWLKDAAGETFIPVEVLTKNSQSALVQPIVEGTLVKGQVVLLK